jgi:hydrogenase expression/formation protein HypC
MLERRFPGWRGDSRQRRRPGTVQLEGLASRVAPPRAYPLTIEQGQGAGSTEPRLLVNTRPFSAAVGPPNDGGRRERRMCLGIPGKVVATYREHDILMGKVDFSGVCKRVCLEHVPQAQPGDYVLVHVGFALSRIDEDEARRVFEFLERMNQLDELKVPSS